MKNDTVTIIAGPCSLDGKNTEQLYEIGAITIPRHGALSRVVWGVRAVGLKSRTSLNLDGDGMGIDYDSYLKNLQTHMEGRGVDSFIVPPSVKIAREFVEKMGVNVATEIVDPALQLPIYAREFPNGKLLIWNPAVNQLGYSTLLMGAYARIHGWRVGIKNGKWLGEGNGETTSLERTWAGIASYASSENVLREQDELIMIHRGVDVTGKGTYRNLPVHKEAGRVKKSLGTRLFFDPSHTCGPGMRDRIVEETLNALHMAVDDAYLYDGILIEVGDSPTDTSQHITIQEFRSLCREIALFRDIKCPLEK